MDIDFNEIESIIIHGTEDGRYLKASGYTFEKHMEAGEMAGIPYIAVKKNDKLVAYLRASFCEIYF